MEVPQLDSGPISGALKDGVWTYLGIPYAAPPVGELRWKEPQPVAAWEEVRPCNSYGPSCPQSKWPYTILQEEMTVSEQSEDCLYLNVWTPASSPEQRLPVMVWIHGGGFTVGSGSQPLYDGHNLAKKGVVLVTINYRLGPLGFMAHPLLSEESPHGVSGNYGLLDQIEALKWVQRNIEVFGGDPGLVTVFGESAGGASVCDLMASPLAAGLFSRAIVESGGFLSFGLPTNKGGETLRQAEALGEKISRNLGCDRTDDELASLRSKSPQELLDAFQEAAGSGLTGRASAGPIADGYVLPDSPQNIFHAGSQQSVPLLIGTNADEGNLFAIDLSPTQYQAALSYIYGNYAGEVGALFPPESDQSARAAFSRLMTEMGFTAGAKLAAASMAKVGAPAYLYKFTQRPFDARVQALGSFHGLEIPYVFANPRGNPGPADMALSASMMGYWTNFARTGNPNGEGLPEWPAYTLESDQYQELGTPILTQSGYYPQAYELVLKTNNMQ
jgi:para-nitrobenzyl esterase